MKSQASTASGINMVSFADIMRSRQQMKHPMRTLFKGLALGLTLAVMAGCNSPEQNAQAYYESGTALIAKKDDLGARLELLKAVKYKSDKVEVWRALAGIDERTGAKSLSLDLRRIVELDPNDLDARLKLVGLMVAGGALEPALRIIDGASEADQSNAQLRASKALIYLRTKDISAAIREATAAHQTDPNNIDAAVVLASRRIAEGDMDGALSVLDPLKPSAKEETGIILLKAQALAKKGDLPHAEDLLRRVVALNPKEATYRTQLIQLLVAERRFDEAEHELRQAADTKRNDSKAGLELVRFLRLTKGPAAARGELDSRIQAGGDIFDYQIALSELDATEGKLEEAAKLLQSLIDSTPAADRKATAQVNLASIYLRQGNLAGAEPLIASVITKDRRNTDALKLRAAIGIQRKQFESAIGDLREALNDQPKSADLLLLLAVAYEQSGKNELADRQYADALKVTGFNPTVALQYVAFLQRRGDAAHAEEVLIDMSARYPANIQILSSLAQVRLSRQNWTGALAVADATARLNDGRVLADQIRAAALAGQNKIDESIAALEDAHKASPDAAQPLLALVSAYLRAGKPDRAVSLLSDMNRKFPSNAQILVLRGQAQLAQKKEADALQSFKDAIAQQSKDAAGYKALSELYARQNNFGAAENVIQAGLKEIPGAVDLKLSLGAIQIQKGDYNAAIAQYEQILKETPDLPVAKNNLASLLLDYRSDRASLDTASSLADSLKSADVPQFQDTLGWAQYRRGDYAASVATLEEVVKKLPNLAVAHYHLSLSYAASGRAGEADQQLKIANTLEPDGTALKESIRSATKDQ